MESEEIQIEYGNRHKLVQLISVVWIRFNRKWSYFIP